MNNSKSVQKEVMDLYYNIISNGLLGVVIVAAFMGKTKLKSVLYRNEILSLSPFNTDIFEGLFFFLISVYASQSIKIVYGK